MTASDTDVVIEIEQARDVDLSAMLAVWADIALDLAEADGGGG
jgi:hypothetical protein